MAKTYQVVNVCDHGHNYVCIYDSTTSRNPYKLYRKWYDQGWHRRKVVEYQDFQSILWHLLQAESVPRILLPDSKRKILGTFAY